MDNDIKCLKEEFSFLCSARDHVQRHDAEMYAKCMQTLKERNGENFVKRLAIQQLNDCDSLPGQFKLIGPTQPVVARVSDDIILPCHLEPAVDVGAKTLEWTRPDLKPRFVFVWRAGQDHVNVKNPSYEGRTSLLIGELKHGNISLKLSKVKTSDEGRYKCYIPEMKIDSTVELVVGKQIHTVIYVHIVVGSVCCVSSVVYMSSHRAPLCSDSCTISREFWV